MKTNKIVKWLLVFFSAIGLMIFLLSILLFSTLSSVQHPTMNLQAQEYQAAKQFADAQVGATLSAPEREQAITRFVDFLSNVGSGDYIETHIDQVYAPKTYLNDTLKTFHTKEAIKEHFLKTAKAMTTYSLEVSDVTQSATGYYVTWVMTYSSPKFAKGQDVVSIGVSYVMFDDQGLVILHQDYWDSSAGFFEQLPLISHLIHWVKARL